MTTRFPSLSVKNYQIIQTKLPFFAEVITQLARFSQFEYLIKHGKIQIYKIIKTNSTYNESQEHSQYKTWAYVQQCRCMYLYLHFII